MPSGKLRHGDHRFEWTRAQFRSWAERIGATYGYTPQLNGIGAEDEDVGAPTQMVVLRR
jgi:hypothetical protein